MKSYTIIFLLNVLVSLNTSANEFYQWHLKNNGGEFETRISDIDIEITQAKEGEDIHLPKNLIKKKEIKVAIIDSGIDHNHPYLKNQIIKNEVECQELENYKKCLHTSSDKNICHQEYSNRDTNNNGYPLDCNGWSITQKSIPGSKVTGHPIFSDMTGHGTHISGIIAARNEENHISGIAPFVTIVPIQVANSSKSESPIDSIASGVDYAISSKVDIINLSLGWKINFDTKKMRDSIKKAIEKGIMIVVAGGNDSHHDVSFPCAYDQVICVGALNEKGEISNFSNHGTSIDIMAPGSNILSTWPTNLRSRNFSGDEPFEILSGTSQAAPMVSGALAILLNEGFTPKEVKTKLLSYARKIKNHNFGKLDINAALKNNASSLILPVSKSPIFLNFDNTSKIQFSLHNIGTKEVRDINIKLLNPNSGEIIGTSFEKSFKPNEIKKYSYPFVLPSSPNGLDFFPIVVESKLEKSIFKLWVNTVKIIHPESEEYFLPISGEVMTNSVLKPFENITSEKSLTHFLAQQNEGLNTTIQIIKEENQASKYILSKPFKIRDKRPTILNLSCLDIDSDGEDDFVITYVYVNKDGVKITKFLIFDETLSPKKYLISPKNEYSNKDLFLPGKYFWLKLGSHYFPSWIGYGKSQIEIPSSPWESTPSTDNNYLFYLTSSGLKNFLPPKDELFQQSLPQSTLQKRMGEFDIITSTGIGFFKKFKIYNVSQNQIIFKKTLSQTPYFDLINSRPLPLSIGKFGAFFYEHGKNGDMYVYTINQKENYKTEKILIKNTMPKESIKQIYGVSDKFILFQTNFNIGLFNRMKKQTMYLPSKLKADRRRYIPLYTKLGIHQPKIESPGLTSEVITIGDNEELNQLGKNKFLSVNGCEEVSIVKKLDQDFLTFICQKSNRIYFLPLNET